MQTTLAPFATEEAPLRLDYFTGAGELDDDLHAGCACGAFEGPGVIFTRRDALTVSCLEHAPLYYAGVGATCDETCGEPGVLAYNIDGRHFVRCRRHANVFVQGAGGDLVLMEALISYDSESEYFEQTWSADTGWNDDAIKGFVRDLGTTDVRESQVPLAHVVDVPRVPAATIDPSTYLDSIFVHSSESMYELPDGVVHAAVCSPPYFGHRDYGADDQIGLEASLGDFIARLVDVFREVRRVLRPDGTAWIVMGDSYASKYACNRGSGHKLGAGACPKEQRQNRLSGDLKEMDLMMVPHELALALRKDGWLLRDLIVWNKPHPRPEPHKTRRLTTAHELIIRVAKQHDYYFDSAALDAVNLRNNVWTVSTSRRTNGHPATYPAALVAGCVVAAAPLGGLILDPFGGSGTTGLVARALGRHYVMYDTSAKYAEIARTRLATETLAAAELPAPFRSMVLEPGTPLSLLA